MMFMYTIQQQQQQNKQGKTFIYKGLSNPSMDYDLLKF